MDDSLIWMILILTIVICDCLAVFLYQKKKIPLWVSAIGMALLVPVIVGLFINLGLSYAKTNYPEEDRVGIAFAGGFMAVFLGFHAVIVFAIGIILNIWTFVQNKRKAKKNHVL